MSNSHKSHKRKKTEVTSEPEIKTAPQGHKCTRCKVDTYNRLIVCKECYKQMNVEDEDKFLLELWEVKDEYTTTMFTEIMNHFTDVEGILQEVWCMGSSERLKHKSKLIDIIQRNMKTVFSL